MAVAVLSAIAVYATIGALFGIMFVWRGVCRIDAAARGGKAASKSGQRVVGASNVAQSSSPGC